MPPERQSAPPRGRPRTPRVAVVGGGVGGLAAAIDLARAGLDVTVLERAAAVGGKVHEVRAGDRPLDGGPTVFTMRWVFDALFDDAGASLAGALGLAPLAVLARHAWQDGGRLDLHADLERSVDAVGTFAGAGEARAFRAFSERSAAVWNALDASFVRASRPTAASLTARVGLRGLPGLLRGAPFATLGGELARTFRDPRLVQLFGRYATYVGASPFAAPATLMLVAHVERCGVWSVQGGMQRLAEALGALAARLGATVRTDADVARIETEAGRAHAVVLGSGGAQERLVVDAVVHAGDVAALGEGLLGDAVRAAAEPVAPADRSLSAMTWCELARPRGFDLDRHNVFFARDARAEFRTLFERRRVPDDPTVYVCAQDRAGGAAPAPAGGRDERLFCLVNAPALARATPSAAPTSEEIDRCRTLLSTTLAACGLAWATPSASTPTTPADFARRFPGSAGALYGRASHGWAASFRRPGARSAIPGLYLAGGTVHPGAGVPMAALSGRQAAASLLADLATRSRRASTGPWRTAATPGGTSTR